MTYDRFRDPIHGFIEVNDYELEDICCKGWMSNPLLKQQGSQLIRSRLKRFCGKGCGSITQAA